MSIYTTYTVTCAPGLMTDAELRRELSNAEAHRRNAETDSSADAWNERAERLYAELELREAARANCRCDSDDSWMDNHPGM